MTAMAQAEGPVDADPLRSGYAGEGWHLDPLRGRVMRLLAPLGMVLLLAGAGLVAADGKTVEAAFLALVAVALGVLPWGMPRAASADQSRSATVGSAAGLLLPLRPTPLAVVAALLCVAAAFLLLAGSLLAVALRRDQWLPGALALLPLAVGLSVGAVAVGGLLERRAADRGFLLTPASVQLRTHTVQRVPWEDLAGVRAHWTRRVWGIVAPGDQVQNWLTLELTPDAAGGARHTPIQAFSRGGGPGVRAETLAVDPHTARDLLRHYLDHPRDRARLADPELPTGYP